MLRKLVAVCTLAAGLGGCVILPIPIAPSGEGAGQVTKLQIGKSTRAEVHGLLGKPNLLTTPRHELWELERDPFHLFLIIGVMPGPGGGGVGWGPVYLGEEPGDRHRIAIAYDDKGKVSGWRLESVHFEEDAEVYPSSRAMYADSAPAAEPPSAGRSRIWTAEAYALSPDGERAALLHIDEQTGPRLELLDLARVRRIAVSREWPEACGDVTVMLGFDGEEILSLPSRADVLCRWRVTDDSLVAEVTSSSILRDASEGRSMGRLLGRHLIVRKGTNNISVWDAAGREIKILPTEDQLSASNLALDTGGSLLAVAFFRQQHLPQRVLLIDVTRGVQQVLSLTALVNVAAVAMAPASELLAVRDHRHVQVWRLRPGLPGAPVLEAVLPLPFALPAGPQLAFSGDASRLVLAATGALVWDVDGWRQIGRVPFGTFPNAVTNSRRLELTPDGSHIATSSGLWRIAPKRPGSQEHEG